MYFLADARVEAGLIMRGVRNAAADPAGERKRARTRAKAQPIRTLRDLSAPYLANCRAGLWKPRKKVQSARTLKDAEDGLNRHILPAIGGDELANLTRESVKRLLREMAARGIRGQTNLARSTLSRILWINTDTIGWKQLGERSFDLGGQRLMCPPCGCGVRESAAETPDRVPSTGTNYELIDTWDDSPTLPSGRHAPDQPRVALWPQHP